METAGVTRKLLIACKKALKLPNNCTSEYLPHPVCYTKV